MTTYEFSDGFDAVGWFTDHPSAMDGDGYPDIDEFGWSDVKADADTLVSAGMGTDEDYGWYGGEDAAMESFLFGDC